MKLKKVMNVMWYIFVVVGVLFVAWMVLSYLEGAFHNLQPDYVYSDYNLFRLICKGASQR